MSEDEDRQRRSMSSVTVLGTAGLNFQTWNDDFKSALGMKKLQRYVERKEDKTAKKPKPVRKEGEAADDYETRMEKWEDEANMVMGILRRSLGDHRSLIKGMTDPLDAYEVITKQYSGETEYDIIDLMQRFAITKPKGDDLLGYLTEMQHLQSTLKSLKLEYNDTMLIGTMLYQLKNYETGHPFRTLYNELSFKFKDKPSEIDMQYFVRFAKNTIREVTLDARDAAEHVKLEGDGGSALAVKKGYGRSGIAKPARCWPICSLSHCPGPELPHCQNKQDCDSASNDRQTQASQLGLKGSVMIKSRAYSGMRGDDTWDFGRT